MKQSTIRILESIIKGTDVDAEIERANRYFATLIRPKKLTGKMTDEVRYEHSFEQNCIVLSKFINQPVKTLTTKEYFTLIEYYNAQARKR